MSRLAELETRIEKAEDQADELGIAIRRLQGLVNELVDLMEEIGRLAPESAVHGTEDKP